MVELSTEGKKRRWCFVDADHSLETLSLILLERNVENVQNNLTEETECLLESIFRIYCPYMIYSVQVGIKVKKSKIQSAFEVEIFIFIFDK